MSGLAIDFVYSGNLDAPTGGYGFDRRVIAELRSLGCAVRTIGLPGSFPNPSAADLDESARLLAQEGRDALIIDGLVFGALPEALAAKLSPAPVALTHHPLFLETGVSREDVARFRASETAALKHASAVVTTSRMTADIVAREFGVEAGRLFVAEPGVEPAPRAAPAQDGIVRLVSVGSLIPRKSFDDLFRALAGVGDDWRLRVAGSFDHAPDHAQMLVQLIADLGLRDRITLEGALPADEIAALYASADVFVTSSHFEGYGMAIAEAIARGLPVIAANEVAAAGAAPADALLAYPAGDLQALRARLTQIIEDSALRKKLGEAAWAAAGAQPRWRAAGAVLLRAAQFAREAAR